MIKIILAVTNDIVTDNRLHKVTSTLSKNGYYATIVGRRFKFSRPIEKRAYYTRRFRLWFNKSVLFYANYNIRLFFYLLKVPVHIIVSNDLDTLPACWLAAKIRKKVLVFDSHEMFTEVPELVNRKLIRNAWKFLERILVPGVDFGYTVSGPIQKYYRDKYNKDFSLIRNVGYFRHDLTYKENYDQSVLIYQGAVNVGRGIELMIDSMQYIDDAHLWIIGAGDILDDLKQKVEDKGLQERVLFKGRIPFDELWRYTIMAHVGFSLEEDLGLNYRYALPNKLFDYVQARVPVIVSDLPEMKKVVQSYETGLVLEERSPQKLAGLIKEIRTNENLNSNFKQKIELASRELCWEREEEELILIYRSALEKANGQNF